MYEKSAFCEPEMAYVSSKLSSIKFDYRINGVKVCYISIKDRYISCFAAFKLAIVSIWFL